jgi:CheY-like chemotaxis protein
MLMSQILVVDDDPTYCKIASVTLERGAFDKTELKFPELLGCVNAFLQGRSCCGNADSESVQINRK